MCFNLHCSSPISLSGTETERGVKDNRGPEHKRPVRVQGITYDMSVFACVCCAGVTLLLFDVPFVRGKSYFSA